MASELGLAGKVERLHRTLARARIPHAFGGALALAYYATPRATIDIDVNVFVSTDRYGAVATVLRRLGVEKIPDASEAIRDGQVRTWWGSNPVDLFFSYDEIHDAMRDSLRVVPFDRGTIPILAPEHLLVAKAAFDRAKDWIDIEQMLVAVDDLDVDEVIRWLIHLIGEPDPRVGRFRTLCAEVRGSGD